MVQVVSVHELDARTPTSARLAPRQDCGQGGLMDFTQSAAPVEHCPGQLELFAVRTASVRGESSRPDGQPLDDADTPRATGN